MLPLTVTSLRSAKSCCRNTAACLSVSTRDTTAWYGSVMLCGNSAEYTTDVLVAVRMLPPWLVTATTGARVDTSCTELATMPFGDGDTIVSGVVNVVFDANACIAAVQLGSTLRAHVVVVTVKSIRSVFVAVMPIVYDSAASVLLCTSIVYVPSMPVVNVTGVSRGAAMLMSEPTGYNNAATLTPLTGEANGEVEVMAVLTVPNSITKNAGVKLTDDVSVALSSYLAMLDASAIGVDMAVSANVCGTPYTPNIASFMSYVVLHILTSQSSAFDAANVVMIGIARASGALVIMYGVAHNEDGV